MKPFSEATARLVDEEVRTIVEGERQRACELLAEKRELLEKVARTLLEKEVLTRREFEEIVGPRPVGEWKEREARIPVEV